ncbi:Uma2 family endonuclease, partial [Spirulina subsalsa FACHB-351]|nr:Uma2 family endonuclease [Spirulina subsalsa FACHB-351]
PPLRGRRLVGAEYEILPLEELEGDILSIPSQVLGLELRVLSDCRLRFFDSVSGEYLRSPEESEQERIQERMRAEQERMRAEQAERELEQLRNLLRERGIDPDDWSTY